VDEIGCLHGKRLAGGRVDFVFGLKLKPCHRNGFDRRCAWALDLSPPLTLVAPATAPSAPAAPSGRRIVLGGLFSGCAALLRSLLLKQRLPVGDRDLVVVWMNFGKG
jgi:hypothetical protein